MSSEWPATAASWRKLLVVLWRLGVPKEDIDRVERKARAAELEEVFG